jgi:hypothetical protein
MIEKYHCKDCEYFTESTCPDKRSKCLGKCFANMIKNEPIEINSGNSICSKFILKGTIIKD